jgi:ubiquitin-like modifier-activating enzyme ATG7
MPGHYINEVNIQKVVENLNIVDQLVQAHDVVFLLTDSREARWLPTVLASVYDKVICDSFISQTCFAVALGFDSFLIIRHGISVKSHDPGNNIIFKKLEKHGDRLSCYFCNDINAP